MENMDKVTHIESSDNVNEARFPIQNWNIFHIIPFHNECFRASRLMQIRSIKALLSRTCLKQHVSSFLSTVLRELDLWSCMLSPVSAEVCRVWVAFRSSSSEWMIKCETGREAGAPSGCLISRSRSFTPNQSWPGPQGLLGLSREGLTHTDSFMRLFEVLSQSVWVTHLPVCPAARAANSHRNSHASFWSVFTFNFQIRVLLMLHQ